MLSREGLIAQWEARYLRSGFVTSSDPVIVYRDPIRIALASAVINAKNLGNGGTSRIRCHFDLVNGFAIIASPVQSARASIRKQVEELFVQLR
jgi:hypothetical protein